MATETPLGPGVHRDVPAAIYHALPYASASRLNALCGRTPAHVRYEMDNPKEPTDAMELGTAIHCAVLEPSEWARTYLRGVEGNRNSNAVKDGERALLAAAAPGAQILKPTDFDKVVAIRDAVLRHPTASLLINACAERELTIVWDDAATGVRCKARLDGYSPGSLAIADVKSTKDASADEWERSVWNRGYHRQSAMYLDGCRAVGLNALDFAHILVETEAPYLVACRRLADTAIEAGRHQLRPLLATWAECEHTGVWPGYDEGIPETTLPAWAWNRIEMEVTA